LARLDAVRREHRLFPFAVRRSGPLLVASEAPAFFPPRHMTP
jgi:hypothetical protein